MSNFSQKYCANCGSSAVCSVLQLLTQNPRLNDAMGSCHYFNLIQGQTPNNVNFGSEQQLQVSREEIARKLKEAQAQEDKEEVIRPSSKLYCHDCGKNDVELLRCSKCGELVCADCMTDTIDGRTLCQSCYDAEIPAML